MSFNLNNALDDKITVVRGIPGDIVIFGIDGTIADSGVPISIGSGQAKQPTAVPGDLAVFGSGVNQGQNIDSGLTVDDSFGFITNCIMVKSKNRKFTTYGFVFTSCR